MDREYFIKNSIMNLRHKRFKNEQEIISKISSYNDILNIDKKKIIEWIVQIIYQLEILNLEIYNVLKWKYGT